MSSEHEEPELIEDVAAEAPPPPTQDSSVSERRRFAASPPLVVAPTPSHPQRCRAGRDVPYAKLSFPAEDSFRQADRRGTGAVAERGKRKSVPFPGSIRVSDAPGQTLSSRPFPDTDNPCDVQQKLDHAWSSAMLSRADRMRRRRSSI